jgi:hypothetical protein
MAREGLEQVNEMADSTAAAGYGCLAFFLSFRADRSGMGRQQQLHDK